MDDLIEVECCDKRIGMLPGTGAPVTYHTADCPRLDDRVMCAFLTGQWEPTEEAPKERRLRDALWELRRAWLARARAMPAAGFPDSCTATLDSVAWELQAVLETHSG